MGPTGLLTPELNKEAAGAECASCGTAGLVAFFEVAGIPSQTCVLLDDHDEAVSYPSGDLLLAHCPKCGFIQNIRFDPTLVDYSVPTEESQAFSPRFSSFASWLVDELDTRYRLAGKSVLEIGCGKGDFLVLLAERGIGRGVGVDPGYLPERVIRADLEIEFHRTWYGPESTSMTAELVITRHLMEHVPNVGQFLGWLRESVAATPGAALFTEVPDTGRVLAEGAFWDVYYEHCSYFTRGSLARALQLAEFKVDWIELGFDDQYLLAGATPGGFMPPADHRSTSSEETETLVSSFATLAAERRDHWRERIEAVLAGGGSVAVWGGGSKAVAFLSHLGVNEVTVVDINPYKQGKWLPGIALQVEDPGILENSPPDLVIPMNPIYVDEIRADLHSMGLTSEVVPVSSSDVREV